MSLNGALGVGRTALIASQAAIQVAGNNMANAATEGYHRRSVHMTPIQGETVGNRYYAGRGVQLVAVRREVDVALQQRYRDAMSDESAIEVDQRFLTALETLQNELSDNDLSSLLSDFFNSFSELANNPADNAVRSVVIQQGVTLSDRVGDLRAEYNTIRQEVDRALGANVEQVNGLLDQIADLNTQIGQSEGGSGGQANALRDQRDTLIDELSEFAEVTVIEQASGSADVLINSIPVVLAGENRGLELRKETRDGQLELSVRVAADGTDLAINSGTLGGLMRQREDTVMPAMESLDTFAKELIFEVNRVHSQGQAINGFESVTGSYAVGDSTVNLNSEDSNLPFRIENGSFYIHMEHQSTGQSTAYRIDVDGDAMSFDDLLDQINNVVGVPNLTASMSFDRKLVLAADSGWEMSFSEDSSGALAALGVNTFFDGDNAQSITVNEELLGDPSRLAAGLGHVDGSNGTAIEIASLQDKAVGNLGGTTLREYWQNSVNDLAVRTQGANRSLESRSLVRESLYAQIQAVSGVSLDEEAINLLTYQRQFQAAARFISVIDDTIQTLLSIA